MRDWLVIFCITLAAGLSMFVGAAIASIEHIRTRWLENELRHAVIAFGGGILVSAVALVLVPEGIKNHPPLLATLFFGLGGLCFMGVDILLTKVKTKAAQFAAMLLDFIPEVVALGALYLLDKQYAILLTFLIVFQNLPEGFNAYLELCQDARHKAKAIMWAFIGVAFLGPILGLTGYFFLAEHHGVISAAMLFASGGILYLIFQDIAPLAKIKHRWAPALGSVAGFVVGMLGKMLIVHS